MFVHTRTHNKVVVASLQLQNIEGKSLDACVLLRECEWSGSAGLTHASAKFLPLKISQGGWTRLIIHSGLFYTYWPRKRHQDGPNWEGVGNRKWMDGKMDGAWMDGCRQSWKNFTNKVGDFDTNLVLQPKQALAEDPSTLRYTGMCGFNY